MAHGPVSGRGASCWLALTVCLPLWDALPKALGVPGRVLQGSSVNGLHAPAET